MARKPLGLGSIFLIGIVLCNGMPTDDSPDMMLDSSFDVTLPTNTQAPGPATLIHKYFNLFIRQKTKVEDIWLGSVQKRSTEPASSSSRDRFVENKLLEHGQVLEYLVRVAQETQDELKHLADNLSSVFKQPKRPEKVEVEGSEKLEVENQNRRSFNKSRARNKTPATTATTRNAIIETLVDNPIVNSGRKVPQYGLLAKALLLGALDSGTEPTPLVETLGKDNKTEIRRMLSH